VRILHECLPWSDMPVPKALAREASALLRQQIRAARGLPGKPGTTYPPLRANHSTEWTVCYTKPYHVLLPRELIHMSDKKQDDGSSGLSGIELYKEKIIVGENGEEMSIRMKKDRQRVAPSASADADEHSNLDDTSWNLDVKDQALLDSFDSRLTKAHNEMDRILTRLNVE